MKDLFRRVTFRFNGVDYRWQGWFGCQLVSYEWKRVPAGTRRTLDFGNRFSTEFVVFSTHRKHWWCKVETTWTIYNMCGDNIPMDYANKIHRLKKELQNLV